MQKDVLEILRSHHVSFMGGYDASVFGFGKNQSFTALEPCVQFRGGRFDARKIGAFTYLGGGQSQLRHIEQIGRFCSIRPMLTVGSPEHPTSMLSTHSLFLGQWDKEWPSLAKEHQLSPDMVAEARRLKEIQLAHREHRVIIGNDVWIGEGVYISRGVKIGDGSVIAARSVVTRDVPPYAIVAGTPAKVLKYRFSDEAIERLLRLSWWKYGVGILNGIDWTNVLKAMDALEDKVNAGFSLFTPSTFNLSHHEYNARATELSKSEISMGAAVKAAGTAEKALREAAASVEKSNVALQKAQAALIEARLSGWKKFKRSLARIRKKAFPAKVGTVLIVSSLASSDFISVASEIL